MSQIRASISVSLTTQLLSDSLDNSYNPFDPVHPDHPNHLKNRIIITPPKIIMNLLHW